MLTILCLLSCLGAVYCGGIGLTAPLLDYSTAARTSIAYGNSAFLARYSGIAAAPIAAAAYAAPIAPAAYAAPIAPAAYAAPIATAAYAAPLAAHIGHTAIATPLAEQGIIARTAFAAPAATVATPLAATVATPLAATVAAPVAAVAAPYVASAPVVSSVHHVPAVAQVPVTKYEAQPAVIQNVLDVANPKIATRKFEIRRPAIQKDFYDIEERVIVRPAGSAVVELDQPISKTQRGPTVVNPAAPAVAAAGPLVRTVPVAGHALHTQAIFPSIPAFAFPSYTVQGPTFQQPEIPAAGPAQNPPQPAAPAPTRPEYDQSQQIQQGQFDDSDSVSVENPELGRARTADESQSQRQNILLQQRLFEQSLAQAEARAQELQARAQAAAARTQELEARAQAEARAQQEQQARARAEARAQQELQARARIQAQQEIIDQQQQLTARFSSQQATERQSAAPAPVRESQEVSSRTGEIRFGDISLGRSSIQAQEIPSVRNLPEVELSNQARLIALLTERGSVSELRSADNLDGRVRARVLSATPAPPNADARDEKVSTRRVVVNRPIQTVQEIDVVQPFTKIERVAVHQPALIKTARFGVANVPTSLPVHSYTHAHYAI